MTRLSIPRPRLLPATIFVAVLMLTVRLGDLWQDFNRLNLADLSVGQTTAQAQDAGAPQAPAPAPAPEGGEGADAGGMPPVSASQVGGQAPARTPGFDDPVRDPANFTQSEIDLLQKLAERREQIEAREKELAMREGLLQAAETRIDRKVAELKELQNTINGLLQQYDEREAEKVAQLVKIYATMKPKDAARIFNELDMPILISVMVNMKESKSAPILASMDAAKARALTEELSRMRRLPAEAGGQAG
ncbi:MotE family protein [Caenispirillum salinarum]|uniref:MotE family protein n=1 Tax=Caenispirillum salinarum TaxID=859058 RepID=UPI00384C3E2F